MMNNLQAYLKNAAEKNGIQTLVGVPLLIASGILTPAQLNAAPIAAGGKKFPVIPSPGRDYRLGLLHSTVISYGANWSTSVLQIGGISGGGPAILVGMTAGMLLDGAVITSEAAGDVTLYLSELMDPGKDIYFEYNQTPVINENIELIYKIYYKAVPV